MSIERNEFNFLSILTGLVVLGYVGVSAYVLINHATTWQDFSGAVGPIAGMLLGYWVKGKS